jgi:hypothetical protein
MGLIVKECPEGTEYSQINKNLCENIAINSINIITNSSIYFYISNNIIVNNNMNSLIDSFSDLNFQNNTSYDIYKDYNISSLTDIEKMKIIKSNIYKAIKILLFK